MALNLASEFKHGTLVCSSSWNKEHLNLDVRIVSTKCITTGLQTILITIILVCFIVRSFEFVSKAHHQICDQRNSLL